MLSGENFTESHIRALQKRSKRDPALLERAVYAFGLLEALVRTGLPFIFKGGTCLMLLLEQPRRLSTDIDVIVEPGTPIEGYIQQASVIFPFVRYEEQKRIGKNVIEKRHFKFTYHSPINSREFYILLDVLFEENPYVALNERCIRNELLLTESKDISVRTPDIDCILGDKLTAFAPHTIGIPLNAGRDMEVMKQYYDVCSLIDVSKDFDKVSMTYGNVSMIEIAYRDVEITPNDALEDTFLAAACIASRGKIGIDDYPLYVKGIREMRGHIFAENYSPEVAAVRAAKLMYMTVCLLTGEKFISVVDPMEYIDMRLIHEIIVPLQYLKKVNLESYAYTVKADRLINKSERFN